MRNFFFLLAFVFLSNLSFAQSTDLDKEYFNYSYVALPSEPIVNAYQRTYITNDDAITIAGYTKVQSDASIEIDFEFEGTLVDNFEITKKKHEKKNKKGEVTATRYSYNVSMNYKSIGRYKVLNVLRGTTHKDKFTNYASYSKIGFDTYSKAQHYYDNNRLTLRDKYWQKHLKEMQESVKDYVNKTYGYPVRASTDYFWILGSKKHPEYAKHHEAFNKTIAAFSKMSYLESTVSIERELQPVIAYFEDVITRYPGNKRKKRKVRFASYYNLAKLYYYLDNVGKMREYAQKLIANDYDKKQGKHFLKDADWLQRLMTVNIVRSRHFDILKEDSSNDNTQENTEESEESNDTSDGVVAYLITQANDTIQASISEKAIQKIAYTADLKVNDGTGGYTIKNYKAQFCKTLALTNEKVYQVIRFDEANTSASNATPQKFAKVLFESDKIALYLFNNKEFVLKFPNETKGKSTSSSSFVFGFNKKLAALASDCSTVLDKTNSKEYKNATESLIEFCRDYTGCE